MTITCPACGFERYASINHGHLEKGDLHNCPQCGKIYRISMIDYVYTANNIADKIMLRGEVIAWVIFLGLMAWMFYLIRPTPHPIPELAFGLTFISWVTLPFIVLIISIILSMRKLQQVNRSHINL